jgi:hypothetical protein
VVSTLRLFIKISVPAVGGVRSVLGRVFACCSLSLGGLRSHCQVVAVAPDQRRSRAAGMPKDTGQERFSGLWILWKTAKVTNSPKAGLLITLSAAVCPQNPQALLAKPHIYSNYFSRRTTDEKTARPAATLFVPAHSVRGFGWSFFRKIMGRAKIPTGAAPVSGLGRPLRGFPCFLRERAEKAGRAHVHIAPRCHTPEPYRTCGFAGIPKASLRRNP